ncbi:hypothetical protein [Bacillus badius]|uniref:Phage protein n=1 Tax=Bacillus badius TaxID=1455 RepID=A0ABR5B013_BACBA|nr:hypothetical protein [Bacillus badius]KIL73208.1 hypothetical protein SD78_3396 [Bacillus badius]KIL80220.1 hypothetical protein SD77_0068 [Bacillus badius]KZR56853.1 hypothetical protein A3781_06250 [Bacillus badius]MED4717004.1 hypothetical protein [Bacillus badius]
MKAKIKLTNTVPNQEIARKIKRANQAINNVLDISFAKDLSAIFFEGEIIVIPEKAWFSDSVILEGQAKETDNGYEIRPKDKGKTINLHLDAELVAELNEIRQHVMSKTQHEIILDLFKKGLEQYNKEKL